MQVELTDQSDVIAASIVCGETFVHDGNAFMVISNMGDNTKVFAVRLYSGAVTQFDTNQIVNPVKMKAIVTR